MISPVVFNRRLALCLFGAGLLLGCRTPAASNSIFTNQNATVRPSNPDSMVIDSDALNVTGDGKIHSGNNGNLIANGGGNINEKNGGTLIASQVVRKLRGRLLVPAGLVAQGGATIVAQGGANLIAQGGGNVVAQGGANIVTQGGANLAAQASGLSAVDNRFAFGLLQETLVPLEQKPLGGVEVFVADASGKPARLGESPEAITQTDTDGQFTLPWNSSIPVMVIARLQNSKAETVVWRTVSQGETGEGKAFQFDAASACVTIAAFRDRTSVPTGFDLDAFASATQTLRPQLYAGKTPKWSDQLAILSFMATQEKQSPTLAEALQRVRASLDDKTDAN